MRTKESWMLFKQHEIDELDQDDWEHYERGGCLCFAHSSRDCICGSWDVNNDGDCYPKLRGEKCLGDGKCQDQGCPAHYATVGDKDHWINRMDENE